MIMEYKECATLKFIYGLPARWKKHSSKVGIQQIYYDSCCQTKICINTDFVIVNLYLVLYQFLTELIYNV